MRKLVLVLSVVGCGTRHRAEPAPVAPVSDGMPAAIDASAPSPLAGNATDAATELDDLLGNPAMDGSFGGPGLPSGGGYCKKHPIASTMTMSGPMSSSDFDATALDEAIGPRKPDLQSCFDQVACPQLTPYSMRVTFTIESDGSVGMAHAETKNATIKECMEGVLTSLRLPKPSGGAPLDVTYTITFRS